MIPAPQPKILLSIKATDTTIIVIFFCNPQITNVEFCQYSGWICSLTASIPHCQVLLYEKLNKKSYQRFIFDIQDFTITPKAIFDVGKVSLNVLQHNPPCHNTDNRLAIAVWYSIFYVSQYW